jgi:transcriptional regulator with XRE-family HTH domain
MQVLVETRKSKGVTQQELADRMDRPQSYIAKVETGERRLDVVEFVDWLKALDCSETDTTNVISTILSATSRV